MITGGVWDDRCEFCRCRSFASCCRRRRAMLRFVGGSETPFLLPLFCLCLLWLRSTTSSLFELAFSFFPVPFLGWSEKGALLVIFGTSHQRTRFASTFAAVFLLCTSQADYWLQRSWHVHAEILNESSLSLGFEILCTRCHRLVWHYYFPAQCRTTSSSARDGPASLGGSNYSREETVMKETSSLQQAEKPFRSDVMRHANHR